ncbi:PEP-CTERM protein-sorting domain-containing protein [Nitrosospira sp. Nsp14]|uniref:PEP-CTERM sorting domain-containing protein n=1 Tax=Nitrosospira sp. Nsp14 TaxID=1855333 RepID=UPI0008EA4F0E|nr:PEP-CTERM sorting domain-containing protein [Nitrosospira sp. Nsp14]SFH26096.1 PEP-CTERM protein-sorting domain-containing protein [Nitrosospira sp. Nsp14]
MTRYDRTLGLAALGSLALSLTFATVPSAHAQVNVFDGKNFAIDYGVSSGGPDSFYSLSHADATGSATGVEVANLSGWKIDTMGDKVTLTWNKGDDFMNAGTPAFLGFKISDTANQLPDFLGASVTNTAYTPSTYGNLIEGFTPSQVTFDANNIYVNLNTSMWHETPMASMGDPYRDTIALSVTAVPEPETYAMLLAGLGLIGAMAKRRARKNLSA